MLEGEFSLARTRAGIPSREPSPTTAPHPPRRAARVARFHQSGRGRPHGSCREDDEESRPEPPHVAALQNSGRREYPHGRRFQTRIPAPASWMRPRTRRRNDAAELPRLAVRNGSPGDGTAGVSQAAAPKALQSPGFQGSTRTITMYTTNPVRPMRKIPNYAARREGDPASAEHLERKPLAACEGGFATCGRDKWRYPVSTHVTRVSRP